MLSFNPWIVLPVVFVSMAVHELMHAISSYWLGDDTAYHQGRISLNPLRSIDPIYTLVVPLFLVLAGSSFIFGAAKPVQVNFSRLRFGDFGAAIVAGAGPLSNLVIAVIAGFMFRHTAFNSYLGGEILATFVAVNVGFLIFNLIPWPPLDGSRIFYAFAPRPLQEAMESIERAGIGGLVIFMMIFYFVLGSSLGVLIQKFTSSLLS